MCLKQERRRACSMAKLKASEEGSGSVGPTCCLPTATCRCTDRGVLAPAGASSTGSPVHSPQASFALQCMSLSHREGHLLICHNLLHLLRICLCSQSFPVLFPWLALVMTVVPELVIAVNAAPCVGTWTSHSLVSTSAPGLGP